MTVKTNSVSPLPNRILIVRGGAIGDFILTLPVFQALKASFPQANLACLSPVGRGEIVQMAGMVDEIRNLDDRCWASLFAENGQHDEAVCEWLSSFNCIVSFLHDPKGIWEANVVRVSGALFLKGCHRPVDDVGEPASVALLRALEPIGIFNVDPAPRICLSVPRLNPETIALHPGSGSESKNWPVQNWYELISLFLKQGNMKLMIVGGEAEIQKVRHLRNRFNESKLRVLLNEPLTNVARKLSACCAFVGHDSGITHLAAALGIPCVVLWAKTNEKVWRPIGERVKILKGFGGVTMIKPHTVIEAVNEIHLPINKI
jgi:ADP-heptose:LPS heptosyltransferase